MTFTTQTFTSDTTYAIPLNAINITYIIHGGKGGQGGPASTRVNTSGAAGGRGQRISGTLTGVAGSTLTLKMGGNGSRCFGDSGANGGGGYWNGGRGGNNNSYDSSSGWNAGGGGGGGGATAIRIGSTVLAGAGGGGGGACICFSGESDAPGLTSSTINTSGGSNGANGVSSGSSGAWNGAGGGAGGGFPGGTSGSFGPGYAYNAGNDGSGFGGAGGAGLYNTLYHNSAPTLDTSSSDSAFVSISYDLTPPVLTLTSNATDDTIYKGENVTLTYSGVGGTSYTFTATDANGNVSNPIPGTVGGSGIYFPSPATTTTYTYTGTNSAGTSTTSVTITVIDDTPVISLTSNAAGNNIFKGQSVTLTWSATANVAISSTTMTGVASPGLNGSVTVSPTTTTTYTFRATNPSGTSTTSVTITVLNDLPVVTLTSDDADNTIISGGVPESVTLTWSATANTTISSTTMTGVTSPGTSGSVTVSPTTTTTYTFRATTPSGTSTASITITVNIRPIITLTSNTSTISRGQSVNLNWNTTGDADSIVWSSGVPTPATGSGLISGSVAVAPTNSTQYCIYATGPGGVSDAKCVTINVIQIDTSITDYDQSFTNDFTVNIPTYAINVEVDISAAGGRNGGTDAGGASGSGGAGRRATLYFPDYVARTFTIRLGNQGSSGFGCVTGSGAGSGGSSNVARGGNGGNSGPSGCSGGGGGGGGASGIYDSVKNGWVAILGGGGGGGGASWNVSATSGRTGTGMNTGNVNNISIGSNGSSCPTDGGGGGGGGGGATGGSGGNFGLDNNRGGVGGNGGQSAYDNSYCSFNYNSGSQNFGNGSARVRWNIGAPTIDSFTVSPSPIIAGQSTRLTWTSTNSLTGSINNGVNAITVPNSFVDVFPGDDTTYTLTVIGYGGLTDTATVTVVVYIPPTLNLVLSSLSIILGSSTTLSWNVSGDGDALYWIAGGITNTNLNSSVSLSPSVTTTYTGYVTGLGGVSPQASVTLIVYYPPTLIIDYPAVIDYGQQAIIEYEGDYANTSVTLSATYNYDFVPNTTDPIVDLEKASSAEFGPNSPYSGTYNTNIVYNDRGPLSVTYVITANGNGGSVTETFTVLINVDRTPDNINIEETDDLFKDADPVYTPETEVLSEMYLIDDIDMKVEVKSNSPILVDLNANQEWTKLRQIGTLPAVQGSSIGGSSIEQPLLDGIENNFDLVKNESLEDPEEFIVKTSASATFNFSNGSSNITILRGGSVTFNWDLTGGYTSASISNHGTLTSQGSAKTYNVQNIKRWISGSPAPGDHMCSKTNPGGYSAEGVLFSSFTTQAPGTFLGMDAESPGIKPVAYIGYVYPRYSSGHPVATKTIYEKLDPRGGPPNGLGTIWTQFSSGEGPYTANGPNVGFKAPRTGYTDYSGIFFRGNATKTLYNSTSYTISASGSSNYSKTISVTVLVPPTISITSSQGASIVSGNCTTLSWNVNGDGNSVSWTQGGISNANINSSQTVCPNDTTTYCAVASGPGGVSPETCIKITVYQTPIASITVPAVINYNNNFTIGYETQYANTSIQITPTYTYQDGTVVTGTTINRTAATSAEINGGASGTVNNTIANGTGIPITVPWNNFGPYVVDFYMVSSGSGGTDERIATTLVNIDQTPDNFIIDETEDLLTNQDPAFTPETEILSEMYLINDIDIPVEIKADYPIKVDINKNNDWDDVRQI